MGKVRQGIVGDNVGVLRDVSSTVGAVIRAMLMGRETFFAIDDAVLVERREGSPVPSEIDEAEVLTVDDGRLVKGDPTNVLVAGLSAINGEDVTKPMPSESAVPEVQIPVIQPTTPVIEPVAPREEVPAIQPSAPVIEPTATRDEIPVIRPITNDIPTIRPLGTSAPSQAEVGMSAPSQDRIIEPSQEEPVIGTQEVQPSSPGVWDPSITAGISETVYTKREVIPEQPLQTPQAFESNEEYVNDRLSPYISVAESFRRFTEDLHRKIEENKEAEKKAAEKRAEEFNKLVEEKSSEISRSIEAIAEQNKAEMETIRTAIEEQYANNPFSYGENGIGPNGR